MVTIFLVSPPVRDKIIRNVCEDIDSLDSLLNGVHLNKKYI